MGAAGRPLRVGFCGAGLIASYHQRMVAAAVRDHDLPVVPAGVYDPDPERAVAFAGRTGHVVVADADAVIDGADAIYVCTWTSEHRRLVEAALAAGRHVFVEKPLATSLADAEAMARAAAGAPHLVTQVGLVLRHSPAYRGALALIRDPAAGPLQAVVFRDDQYLPTTGWYASTWRGDVTKAGAGTLLEHSVHDLDLLAMLGGPIVQVAALDAHHHGLTGIEDVMAVSLRFANGATGTLTSIWHDNLARGSLRRLELFCAGRFVCVGSNDTWGPVSWQDSDGATGSWGEDELRERAADWLPTGTNPDADFLRACLDGRPAFPGLDLALAAQRVADAIYRSAAGGVAESLAW